MSIPKTVPCAAVNCDRDVTYSESVKFPSVPETALKWAKAVGLEKYKPNSRICLLHFDLDEDFIHGYNGFRRIKPDKQPTKNLPTVRHFFLKKNLVKLCLHSTFAMHFFHFLHWLKPLFILMTKSAKKFVKFDDPEKFVYILPTHCIWQLFSFWRLKITFYLISTKQY